jgi:hypothetical protein
MFILNQGENYKLEEAIIVHIAQERLRQFNNFGWSITKYLYTLQKV